jgi:hypothetical protein
MRYETAAYLHHGAYISLEDIKKTLPQHIISQLLDSKNELYVKVETFKTEVVEYLDKHFRIGESFDFTKNVSLETDKSEIPNFTHFHIMPDALEFGRHVFCNIIRPTCRKEACPAGSKICGPVRIHPKKNKRIGITRIARPWANDVELVISPLLKNLFDEEGITGLEYERCMLENTDWLSEPPGPAPYFARIVYKTKGCAEDIKVKEYICEEHSYLMRFAVNNGWVLRDNLSDDDFQCIDGVVIKGRTYRYPAHPGMIISRKLLQLLLKHKIRGLCPATYHFNEKFRPEAWSELPVAKTLCAQNV